MNQKCKYCGTEMVQETATQFVTSGLVITPNGIKNLDELQKESPEVVGISIGNIQYWICPNPDCESNQDEEEEYYY